MAFKINIELEENEITHILKTWINTDCEECAKIIKKIQTQCPE